MSIETFSFASDLHGDRMQGNVVNGFLKFVDDFKPKLRIFGGDIWDFRAIRMGADKEEKLHSMRTDFEAGMGFLERYKPHVITLGNHDQRLFDIVEKDGLHKTGPLVDYAGELIERFEKLAAKLGTAVLPYDKRKGVYSHKGLKFAHGFSQGSEAASNMARIYGNILFGHGHSIDEASEPGTRPRVARMVGCLCDLNLTYNRSQLGTLRQRHGWAYGAFFDKGFQVMQAEVANGQIAYADHLKLINV